MRRANEVGGLGDYYWDEVVRGLVYICLCRRAQGKAPAQEEAIVMEVELVRELYTYTNRTPPKRDAIDMKETESPLNNFKLPARRIETNEEISRWVDEAFRKARMRFPNLPLDELSFILGVLSDIDRHVDEAREDITQLKALREAAKA